ncbi:MAG TPA: hypothetical protein VFZ00_00885 [Solirubrobacter sp.]|nr:hypothetical protein [Solirubrobacter sp.]
MTAMIEPALTAIHPDPRERTGGRDPAHELYEHAAGLLESAQSLQVAARAPGAVAATAPTLACLEASLSALTGAVDSLRGRTLERLSDPVLPVEDLRPQRAEIALQLERLAGILEQASQAASSALDSMEPVNDELRAI